MIKFDPDLETISLLHKEDALEFCKYMAILYPDANPINEHQIDPWQLTVKRLEEGDYDRSDDVYYQFTIGAPYTIPAIESWVETMETEE